MLDLFKDLQEIIKIIQFEQDLSLDDIAKSIGYSRSHLNQEKNAGSNNAILNALKSRYHGAIQHFVGRYANVYYQSEKANKEAVKEDLLEKKGNERVSSKPTDADRKKLSEESTIFLQAVEEAEKRLLQNLKKQQDATADKLLGEIRKLLKKGT